MIAFLKLVLWIGSLANACGIGDVEGFEQAYSRVRSHAESIRSGEVEISVNAQMESNGEFLVDSLNFHIWFDENLCRIERVSAKHEVEKAANGSLRNEIVISSPESVVHCVDCSDLNIEMTRFILGKDESVEKITRKLNRYPPRSAGLINADVASGLFGSLDELMTPEIWMCNVEKYVSELNSESSVEHRGCSDVHCVKVVFGKASQLPEKFELRTKSESFRSDMSIQWTGPEAEFELFLPRKIERSTHSFGKVQTRNTYLFNWKSVNQKMDPLIFRRESLPIKRGKFCVSSSLELERNIEVWDGKHFLEGSLPVIQTSRQFGITIYFSLVACFLLFVFLPRVFHSFRGSVDEK